MSRRGSKVRPRRHVLGSALVALAALSPAPAQEAPAPQVAWKYAPRGSSFSGVEVRGGLVFALDRDGSVHALDAATGEKRWVSSTKLSFGQGYGLALPPDEDAGVLYVGGDHGLVALDTADGAERWRTGVDAGVAGPACTDELVMAGSSDGKVYGCRASDGRIVWEHDYVEDRPDDPEGFDSARAVFAGKRARPGRAATDGDLLVVPVFDQCRVVALGVATGKRRWAFDTEGWVGPRPAIGPRNVYVGSQDKHLYAVDKVTGKQSWQLGTRGRVSGSAAPTERFVYFGSCDARLYAVDMVVGQVRWKYETEHREGYGAPIYSRPLVLGDVVHLAAMSGKVYAVRRDDGEHLWKLQPVAKSEPNSDLVSDGARLFLTVRKDGNDGESAVVALLPPER